MQLGEALRLGTAFLARSGEIGSPRRDAEELLRDALSLTRLELYLQFERPLTDGELTRIRDLLRRRRQQEPMAYLLGEVEFHGLEIRVVAGILIPRPESELLVELALAQIDKLGPGPTTVADLGCGSGCLGIAIAAAAPEATIYASDVSEIAAATTRQNAKKNGVGDRVTVTQSSWASGMAATGPLQVVVANPPYVTSAELDTLDRSVRDFEPRLALDGGPDGLTCYRELGADLVTAVAPGTAILLEGDPRRLEAVAALMAHTWPQAGLTIHKDTAERDRVLEVLI
ncbi:MAG TPA: peptide chain release factor N(5)-glutamine methyltransferase [Candidatus Dormibacteraeota bacterium]|nr:peptide chain release factor N(5)-glutamine methyltransferase [Candidatus Dormibacteraeota bacterium]